MSRDLEPLRFEERICPAAVPAARYVATILPGPRTAAVGSCPRTGNTFRLHPPGESR
ncbi:hypothetical protein [Streptomyces sp. NPDC017958]|uniref:hypothetical protein n=1 Tax=Streptomyces sp. NPDC017958 TaxID=3365021 RepID=UPI0037B699E3